MVERLLLGPGPSNVPPEVMAAMLRPTLGHLDPDFLACMQRVRERLQQVFRTKNALTLAASGTGTSGMELAITNLVEPRDRVVVVVNGFFGGRGVEMAKRLGAEVAEVKFPWGQPADAGAVEKALAAGSRRSSTSSTPRPRPACATTRRRSRRRAGSTARWSRWTA
jgi:alanine-glyoxylate transaminase/serine-glyoxylate transaminase/serine-pyruvate transaminase